MPRPRFEKLDPDLKRTILARAAEEFAEHGFEGASYNRIIERSGLSKGAMYYYFDDKEDLFVTTLNDAVKRYIVDTGNIQAATDAESFWREVEAWCGRSLRLFLQEPAAMGLLRTLMKSVERGTGSSALPELRNAGRVYMDQFIAAGQAVSAIRDDLPDGLLTTVLMWVEEATHVWFSDNIGELDDDELTDLPRIITALYRRIAAPAETTERAARPKTRVAARRKGKSR